MSRPNPSTIEPAAVWKIEVNGPANIITAVDTALALGRPIDTGYIRQQARLFDRYVAKLEEGRQIMWHEHLKEEAKL